MGIVYAKDKEEIMEAQIERHKKELAGLTGLEWTCEVRDGVPVFHSGLEDGTPLHIECEWYDPWSSVFYKRLFIGDHNFIHANRRNLLGEEINNFLMAIQVYIRSQKNEKEQ